VTTGYSARSEALHPVNCCPVPREVYSGLIDNVAVGAFLISELVGVVLLGAISAHLARQSMRRDIRETASRPDRVLAGLKGRGAFDEPRRSRRCAPRVRGERRYSGDVSTTAPPQPKRAASPKHRDDSVASSRASGPGAREQ